MTLEEYIKNPMGKNNAVYSQRELFKEIYTKKFDAVIAREAGTINYRLYKDSDRRYLIHIKIPSELVSKFYYDVIIEFTTNDATIELENSLKNYEVKFFSNDPAFVFTYAYSFAQNKLFIDDLKPKMSKRALKDGADIRNPKNVVGYVKSLYFAYLFIKLRGLDKKPIWAAEGVKYVARNLLAFVENADKKVEDRQIKGEQQEKENKARRKGNPKGNVSDTGSNAGKRATKSVSNTVVNKKTSMIKTIKTTKHTKTTNRK
jgi:hypothetical protein